jgi:transcriptional regulator GlxA family with amidase domain
MPEMDGYSLLKEIRKEKQYSRLPVIMLTAKADDKTKISSLETGANDYLTKPFNAKELLLRVRTQIHLKIFMDELIEKTSDKSSAKKNITDETKEKLERVIEYINKNFKDIINRENLADLIEMSPDHFGRMFRQFTGKKVQDFINDLRINYASKMLLESDNKIIEIAMESGYENLRTFNRDFSNRMHANPTEFKEKRSLKV